VTDVKVQFVKRTYEREILHKEGLIVVAEIEG